MLLSQAWSAYEADKRLEGYSQYTLKSYRLQSTLLIRAIGDVDIGSITYEQLKAYLAEAAKHLKPSSVACRIKYPKSLFRWAQDEGLASQNPAARLKEPKQGARVPKALSEEDTEMLREGCMTPMEHALIEFMYTTGCRIGEVFTLNRNALNWEDRSCIVRGKGDKEREVYFSIKAEIWLKKYLRARKDTDMALFVTERAPRRMGIDQIRRVVKRVAAPAGTISKIFLRAFGALFF